MPWSTVQEVLDALSFPAHGAPDRAAIDRNLSAGCEWQSEVFDELPILPSPGKALDRLIQIAGQFSELSIEARWHSEDGDVISFEVDVRGTVDHFLGRYAVRGREVKFSAAGVVELDNAGQISKIRTYWNCAHVLAQVGVRAHGRPSPAVHI
jgi:hypothetical protein